MLSEIKSDRERQIRYITYMWNLKNTTKLVNLSKRSRPTNTENKLMVTSGECAGAIQGCRGRGVQAIGY